MNALYFGSGVLITVGTIVPAITQVYGFGVCAFAGIVSLITATVMERY